MKWPRKEALLLNMPLVGKKYSSEKTANFSQLFTTVYLHTPHTTHLKIKDQIKSSDPN